jgi:curved DNA-binding protein CbpA
MSSTPVAQALLHAYRDRFTGFVHVVSGGRTSWLGFREGDLVDAQVRVGHQTAAQALLQSGRLNVLALDALWARGAGAAPDGELRAELGLAADAVEPARALACVRQLSAVGETAELEPQDVEPRFHLPGARAVRAAFEAAGEGEYEQTLYRCVDAVACAEWCESDEELELVSQLTWLDTLPVLDPARRALLRVLALQGSIEPRDATESDASAEEISTAIALEIPAAELSKELDVAIAQGAGPSFSEEALGPAAEELPILDGEPVVEAEEVGAAAIAAGAEEVAASGAAIAPDAEEVAASDAEIAAETDEMDFEDVLIGGDEPETAVDDFAAANEAALRPAHTPDVRVHSDWEPDAPPMEKVLADAADAPPDWAVDVPEEDLAASRRRAQDELAREMNEALRRAGAAPVEAWLEDDTESASMVGVPQSATEAEPTPAPEFGVAVARADEEDPGEWQPTGAWEASHRPQPARQESWIARASVPLEPARFPAQTDEPQDDLWRIVRFDQPTASGVSVEPTSFEEALRDIDQHLERLVGMSFQDLAAAEEQADVPQIEPIIEEVEPTWVGRGPTFGDVDDRADASVHTPDELAEDWRLDEEDLTNDPSDPAEAARLRRKRLLRRAMENIGSLPRPAQQNAEGLVAPEMSPAAEPPPPPEPSPSGEALTAAERKTAALIEEQYRALADKPTHFAVLGVGPQPTKDQVKTAFLELAKVFHPDRLPRSLAALAPKMTAVFEAIREAYDVLHDDQRRRQYVQMLQVEAEQPKGGPDLKTGAQAAEEFKKGEALFRKREFQKAEEHYVRAYGLDPKADYLAARAWAVYMDPGRKHEAARARQMLEDALKASPSCDRAHYHLGIIARMDNDIASAERHFRDAVKANPRHLEANQELRLIEMRKKKSGKKGFFS